MEKIYILGNNQTLKEISDNYIELPDLNKEYEIHDWIVKLFNDNEIEKLVIEIGENPELSLKLGYHIRLSIENLNEKVLIPLLFISTSSLNSILLKARLFSQILSTKGTYFTEFNDLDSAKEEVSLIEGLAEYDYVTGFLKVIHLLPDETIGRHSLANIWGAYAMDKAANTNALPQDSDFKKKLYFKYMAAFANLNKIKPLNILGKIQVGKANTINATGKKILLIDDEADKGWESVLRKVFKTTSPEDFVVINEKVTDFEGFSSKSKHVIENQRFDLYLVDLRLNGLEEEETIKTEDFSGMKVLQKIKSINQGYQVIVFTASNKAWNLKALLDAGADGYYMKESPEYNFSRKYSEQNYFRFQEDVQNCFDKRYLREISPKWDLAKRESGNTNKSFIQESNSMLNIAWNLISQEQIDLGYLTLFQIIELYANEKYNWRDNSIELEGVKHYMIEYEDEDKENWKLTFNQDKRNGDYFSSGDEVKEKDKYFAQPLFKASCILKFIYSKDNSFLEEFGKLNDLRHKIAHKGAKKFVNKDDIIKALKIINLFRQKIN